MPIRVRQEAVVGGGARHRARLSSGAEVSVCRVRRVLSVRLDGVRKLAPILRGAPAGIDDQASRICAGSSRWLSALASLQVEHGARAAGRPAARSITRSQGARERGLGVVAHGLGSLPRSNRLPSACALRSACAAVAGTAAATGPRLLAELAEEGRAREVRAAAPCRPRSRAARATCSSAAGARARSSRRRSGPQKPRAFASLRATWRRP